MAIVIDPQLDLRMGCRESHERRADWHCRAGTAFDAHPHTRPLWPWERDPEDDLPPCEGEAYRDILHDIHHAAADAATTKEAP